MFEKIIDIHTHSNCGLKGDVPETNIHKRSFEFVMEDYQYNGVAVGGFSYYSSVMISDEIYECNELLSNHAKNDERVFQWLVLDPRQDKLFEQISQKITDEKVLGVKIHHVNHGYNMEEYGDKIFSFADNLKCFVLMHPDTSKIPDMVRFADKYPNMKLIIAHLGSIEHIEAIEKAKHGNIFTDTSGSASVMNNIVEYAVERVGSQKIFFGTDTYSCGFQKGRIVGARISEQDKENILYLNAKTHFAKQFKNV